MFFSAGAAAIWIAGTRLERDAVTIADRTGIGRAFAGMFLLAGATSLPEVAATTTATWTGNSSLAMHNLLGGVVAQTAVLAIADLAAGRQPLTHVAPRFVLLMQGTGVIFSALRGPDRPGDRKSFAGRFGERRHVGRGRLVAALGGKLPGDALSNASKSIAGAVAALR